MTAGDPSSHPHYDQELQHLHGLVKAAAANADYAREWLRASYETKDWTMANMRHYNSRRISDLESVCREAYFSRIDVQGPGDVAPVPIYIGMRSAEGVTNWEAPIASRTISRRQVRQSIAHLQALSRRTSPRGRRDVSPVKYNNYE